MPLLLILLALYSVSLITLMNVRFPLVGYDYQFFVPRLLEGILFYRAQGLKTPLYSSYLCGGFPFYADPQSMFYSLPQVLSFFADPWIAIQITACLSVFIAGISTYYLARTVLLMSPETSVLLGFFFASSGFLRERFLIGHLAFHGFVLLPLIAWLLFDYKLKLRSCVILLSLSLCFIIQSGGVYPLILILPSLLLIYLVVMIYRSGSFSTVQLFYRSALSSVLALILCASKLVAATSLLANHPRKVNFNKGEEWYTGIKHGLLELFWPLPDVYGKWGAWEYDYSLSLFVLIGIAVLLLFTLRVNWQRKTSIYVCALMFFSFLIFIVSQGISNTSFFLHKLPVLNQARVNQRFLASLILPLCILGALGYQKIFSGHWIRRFIFLSVLWQLLLSFLLVRPVSDYMSFNISNLNNISNQFRDAPLNQLSVKYVASDGVNDFEALVNRTTLKKCYSVFFSSPPNRSLKEGKVDDVDDGSYNLINPACYVYPLENECRAGARILATDAESFNRFLGHQNTNWQVSNLQNLADKVSILGILIIIFLIIYTAHRMIFRKENYLWLQLVRRSASD